MNLKPAPYDQLSGEERLIARIAALACINTIWGGASALVIAKRLKRMGGTDLEYVVSDVYSASTGRHHPDYEAWECPECGQACLGQEAAFKCCNEQEDEGHE